MPYLMLDKVDNFGIVVILLGDNIVGDSLGSFGVIICEVKGIVGVIGGSLLLMNLWCHFNLSYCVGECDLVGIVNAVGVVTLIIPELIVFLKVLLNYSSAWRCFESPLLN